jgi:hypothetical protein
MAEKAKDDVATATVRAYSADGMQYLGDIEFERPDADPSSILIPGEPGSLTVGDRQFAWNQRNGQYREVAPVQGKLVQPADAEPFDQHEGIAQIAVQPGNSSPRTPADAVPTEPPATSTNPAPATDKEKALAKDKD